MEKQIRFFLEFLEKERKLSENTLQSYRRDIKQYEEYINENKLNYLKVEKETINNYLKHLEEMNKKSSTISRNLASIRSFYQFLCKNRKKNSKNSFFKRNRIAIRTTKKYRLKRN